MWLQKLCLVIVALVWGDVCRGRRALVNGQVCTTGYETLRAPSSQVQSCPPFRNERGQCFVGDMELSRRQCIRIYGRRRYQHFHKGIVLPWTRPL